jgi:hypothetical protein
MFPVQNDNASRLEQGCQMNELLGQDKVQLRTQRSELIPGSLSAIDHFVDATCERVKASTKAKAGVPGKGI